jgi:hypothetical protein
MRIVSVVALVTMLSSCANLCDRLASPASKQGSCTNGSITPANKTSCDANASRCTADELKALTAYLDCYDAMPTCVVGKESDYASSLLACAAKSSSISAACNAALFSN